MDQYYTICPQTSRSLVELIEMNGDHGLKNFDEAGLEGNNKILRTIRLKLARKTSQSANLDDTIRRLWLGSDPQVNVVRMKVQPFCKHCSKHDIPPVTARSTSLLLDLLLMTMLYLKVCY